jgi:hypothetical protein
MLGGTRRVGAFPSLDEWIAVEGEEDRGYEDEDGLVERPWYREQSDRDYASKPFWDAAVESKDLDRSDRSDDERARRSHSAPSLGRA